MAGGNVRLCRTGSSRARRNCPVRGPRRRPPVSSLRDRVGAKISLGKRAEAEFPHQKLGDGDTIEFGNVRLKALETPGHTPEGISILAYDLEQDPERPKAVFTGDTLFIGDVGRPDLLASIGVTADELADEIARHDETGGQG